MKIDRIVDPIAQRTLDGGGEVVIVAIGRPFPSDDGECYYCPYSIEFRDDRKVSFAAGIDGVQALQLAMVNVGADLDYISRKTNTPISWFPEDPGDTGFPSEAD